jgi:hypothetical protein
MYSCLVPFTNANDQKIIEKWIKCFKRGEITIKGAKELDNQFFCTLSILKMYHIGDLNYINICFKIMFIYSWSYHPMNLKSFHCVTKVLLHMQRSCWHVLQIVIKYECTFCYSNLHQMLSNFVWALIYFTKRGPCVQPFKNIFTCLYLKLFTWLVKMVKMCLMTKIVHNLSSWLKEKLYILM